MEREKIIDLFKKRDNSIVQKNKSKFLSTQLNGNEIKLSASIGYLELSKLESDVLHIQKDDLNNDLWVVLVREKYFIRDHFSHHGFFIYYIQKINESFLVTDIRY